MKNRNDKLKTTCRCGLSIVYVMTITSLFFLPGRHGFAQNVKVTSKIDPVFRRIMADAKFTGNGCLRLTKSPVSRRKKIPNGIKKSTAEKRYDCIIYTKKPQALRDRKIILNSVLPTFVTSSLSLCEMLQIASMPEVTFIRAPQINHSQNTRN